MISGSFYHTFDEQSSIVRALFLILMPKRANVMKQLRCVSLSNMSVRLSVYP